MLWSIVPNEAKMFRDRRAAISQSQDVVMLVNDLQQRRFSRMCAAPHARLKLRSQRRRAFCAEPRGTVVIKHVE